jgi:hypothetical protein
MGVPPIAPGHTRRVPEQQRGGGHVVSYVILDTLLAQDRRNARRIIVCGAAKILFGVLATPVPQNISCRGKNHVILLTCLEFILIDN